MRLKTQMGPKIAPQPTYSQARESLARVIPPKIICLLACGGRDCRYEGPSCWRSSQQAIKGIFSSWVTDDVVAMARPSTYLIKRYNIIEQFKKLNIKSIINMQLPGEHSHCGPELETDSGFTYSPQIFMENKIYFYNFGMSDFGVSSMVEMLDAVKVLAFSVQEGKVAVHCHAGLGRTGVLIACYLIYMLRISASEAVHYVRIKRPHSIQTRSQINLVYDFARLISSQLAQYPCLHMQHGTAFSLRQYLQRQTLLVHGEEARLLAQTPKILHFLCRLLIALAHGTSSPPDVQVQLQRMAAILALQRAVRDTLVLQKYVTMEVEREDFCESVSWDEQKRTTLLNKRSYSESDLGQITLNKNVEFMQCSTSFLDNGKVCNGIISHLRDQRSTDCATDVFENEPKCTTHAYTSIPLSSPPVCECNIAKECMNYQANTRVWARTYNKKKNQAFLKFSSSMEIHMNHTSGQVSLTSRAVAKAMAQQDPPGTRTLQRVALLQEDLNVSAYGWAMLAMETDPEVLSALMWIWLESLKDPILDAEDMDKLSTNAPGQNPLKSLQKSKHSTLYCLLGCVAQVTTLCPQLETAVLERLIRALTRIGTEDVHYSTLLKVFAMAVTKLRCLTPCHPNMGKPETQNS